MSRLSKSHVHAALDRAARNILSAAGDDPFVSRRDIRMRLNLLSGVERRLTDVFYRFMDYRDSKPGARITKKDIDETLQYAKEKLVDAYDLNNNGLSKSEIEAMSLTGKLAVRFAKILKEAAVDESIEDLDDLVRVLRELGEGLYFPGYSNEGDGELTLFLVETDLEELTPETFAATLNLDQDDPNTRLYIFEQGRHEYEALFEIYEDMASDSEQAQFKVLHEFMTRNLRQITHIIVGDYPERDDSVYPVYFVGLTKEGHIAGFESSVVWT